MRSHEYLLKLTDWQWFGTLTWRDSKLGTVRSREADVDKFLRRYAAQEQVSLTDLPLAIRWERGGQNERPHCHYLLTGLPNLARINRSVGHMLCAIWYRHCGLARIRPWQVALRSEVARYMINVEPERNDFDANDYEICRFDRADRVVFNGALWRELQRITDTRFDVLPAT